MTYKHGDFLMDSGFMPVVTLINNQAEIIFSNAIRFSEGYIPNVYISATSLLFIQ